MAPAVSKPSLLERAIAEVAPQWAMRRHRARMTMTMTGGYAGAGYSERLAAWQPGAGDADTDSVGSLRMLRSRSRDLTRNSPIAAGAIETSVSHVVGTGLSLQSRIKADVLGLSLDEAQVWQQAVEWRFSVWASSPLCDVAEELDFYEQQELALRAQEESGDCAVILAQMPRPDWPFRLALQIIEADRISNPDLTPDRHGLVQGIERAESGAPVAAHICSRHPGTQIDRAGAKWTRVPMRGPSGRRNLLLLKDKVRPGQTRGIPRMAPIIGTLKQMARLSDAEIDAAVNAAAMAVFVKMDPEAFTELFDPADQKRVIDNAIQWDGGLANGRAINLLPGESVEAPQMGRPNPNFEPFMSAFLGYVGMGLNIPKEVLAKHFQSSYSAARAALLDAWRTFWRRRQRHAARLCQPVFEEWLADEVAAGTIAAPGFFADAVIRAAWCASKWTGDGPGSIDPLKEAKAIRERVDIGISTLADETMAFDGGDWHEKHQQRVREVAERVEGGLQAPLTAPAAAMPGAPGVPAAPVPVAPAEDDDPALPD